MSEVQPSKQMGGFDLACEGYGSKPARVMFVGISAGQRGALISKVPLTRDNSGRLFQRCLKDLGLSESDERSERPVLKDCYVTNLVKGACLYKDGRNRPPTNEELVYWYPRFLEEYDQVKPRRLVALGHLVEEEIWNGWPHRDIDGLTELRAILHFVKHPRWYVMHGALAPAPNKSFLDMVREYGLAIQ